MTDVVFVDTSILIYAHDRDAGEKRARAAQVLDRLWDEQAGRLSVQVHQEFYVTVTQKLPTPLARAGAREVVRTYTPWVMIQPRQTQSCERARSQSSRRSRSGMA